MGGQNWKRAGFGTSVVFPGTVFITGFIVNFFIWDKQSSGAVPFTTMIALLLLWFGISTPLIMIGYFFGYRKEVGWVVFIVACRSSGGYLQGG